MVDITTLVLLSTSFFFVALSLALLVRYRQVSERINASTDLGRDLWSSLEQRLKKQDERILDMMGRVEVIQSRAMATAAARADARTSALPSIATSKLPEPEATEGHTPSPSVQQPESHISQLSSVPPGATGPMPGLDETQMAALKLLNQSSLDTRQLTDALGKSREHTARIMKGLFVSGLVKRNDSAKPFVYELTDLGRSRLPAP